MVGRIDSSRYEREHCVANRMAGELSLRMRLVIETVWMHGEIDYIS